ncbi:MAG: TIGR04255 family protein [Propionibacteriaceae bacterium]|jgi:uncharacterized protein (TIGR04255 family)|nr:TIGR04255 family protein [Propionibacteriaceae bacterium]
MKKKLDTTDAHGFHLSKAPLERVLCQARWEQLSRFDSGSVAEVAAKLATVIGDDYPFGQGQQEMQVTISPAGVTQQPGGMIHKFQSADRRWTATLSHMFIALETSRYTDHTEFIDKFGALFDALLSVVKIPSLTRLGYRYTNRLTESEDMPPKLMDYFVPSILGGLGDNSSQVVQTVCETLHKQGGKYLMVRSGLLQPGAVIDPSLSPVRDKSWVIDLDAYEESASIDVAEIRDKAVGLSALASDHFRTLLTEQGLERFQ